MNSEQAIELLKNGLRGLCTEKLENYVATFRCADVQELKDFVETQAQALKERDALVDRQERMIGIACEKLTCIPCWRCPMLNGCRKSEKKGCNESFRRWLEQEAQHD